MPSKRRRTLVGSVSKKPQPPNRFEEQWNKINRTTQRKKQQQIHSSSSNRVIDGRIGEQNPGLDEQSRYLFRLQRERAKRSKKRNLFSLDEEDQIDKDGREFPSLEEMDEPVLSDAGEGSEISNPPEVSDQPFFSVKKSEARHDEQQQSEPELRSKREVMNEVIEKSKMFKTLRQHIKHQTDEETMKLDEKLPQIMHLLAQSNVQPLKTSKLTLKRIEKKISIFDDEDHQRWMFSSQYAGGKTKNYFSYEDVYRQLAQEKRAAPSERLFTEEETAQRQKEHLQKLEELRQARMKHLDDEEGKTKVKASGDDLNDNFGDLQSDSEEDGEERDSESDAEGNEIEKQNQSVRDLPAEFLLAVESDGLKDIPFMFKKAPLSEADLQSLFEGRTVQQRSLIMDRLLKCFAASLNPGKNRPKLIRLSELALQRVLSLCKTTTQFSLAVAEIDMLVTQVHRLGFEHVVNTWGRQQVLQSYTTLLNSQGGLSDCWGLYDVLVLRAVGVLFPASDARHPVSTPLQILLAEALSLERMNSIGDVVLGVLVANVLLELLCEAERFSPQLVVFVVEVLRACTGSGRFSTMLGCFHDSSGTSLGLSEVAVILSGSECDTQAIAGKVINAASCFAEELTFSGRLPHADLVFSQLPLEDLPEYHANRMKAVFERSRKRRFPLQLYTKNRAEQSFKLRNPRFSSENGVFRKRPKSSFDAVLNGDVAASAKRIRRALKKEERGLARDIRREAELNAAEITAKEDIVREDRDARDKTVRAFFETQRATWRAAEKRQKKLSGKKW